MRSAVERYDQAMTLGERQALDDDPAFPARTLSRRYRACLIAAIDAAVAEAVAEERARWAAAARNAVSGQHESPQHFGDYIASLIGAEPDAG
jgi:hypothetical protein